jgi:basic membrane protein A
MLKRVDRTIERITGQILEGKLKLGFTETEGVAEGSLSLVYDEKLVPADVREQVEDFAKRIASGEIKVTSAQ